MNKPLSALAALAVTLAMPIYADAQPRDRTKAGTLTCDISAGMGLIIGSKKDVACVFTPAAAGPREVYVGAISKFGLDIGATTGGEMVWTVFAPSSKKFGALAGEYAGAGAGASVGAGLGANVLVGGSERTVGLQPVSIQGETGLNVAAGVSALSLRPAR
ncbi:MAG: DUF992 domain-containing protein [Pseudolabrys sp.]|nr:DUF992 domain-containing protein [Pseudolabrys sp.]